MKLHADKADRYAITAYGEDWIAVNGERHTRSLLLSATEGASPWDCNRFADLTAAHFDRLLQSLAEPPELVLLGSGRHVAEGRLAHHTCGRSLWTSASVPSR